MEARRWRQKVHFCACTRNLRRTCLGVQLKAGPGGAPLAIIRAVSVLLGSPKPIRIRGIDAGGRIVPPRNQLVTGEPEISRSLNGRKTAKGCRFSPKPSESRTRDSTLASWTAVPINGDRFGSKGPAYLLDTFNRALRRPGIFSHDQLTSLIEENSLLINS